MNRHSELYNFVQLANYYTTRTRQDKLFDNKTKPFGQGNHVYPSVKMAKYAAVMYAWQEYKKDPNDEE